MDPLIIALHWVRRKLLVQQAVRLGVEGLFLSCSACTVWLVLTRLFPVLGDPVPVCVALMGGGLVAGMVLGVRRRPGLAAVAVLVDQRAELKERLISSVQLAAAGGPMVEALHLDARRHLERLDLEGLFPFAPSVLMRWVFVPVLALGLAYELLPELDLLGFRPKQAQIAARKAATAVKAKRIEAVAAALKPMEPMAKEESGRLTDVVSGIQRVAEDLKAGTITDKVAFSRLTALQTEVDKMREGLGKEARMPSIPRLVTSSGALADGAADPQKGRLTDAADKLREMREKLKKGDLSPEELKRLQGEMDELSKAPAAKDGVLAEALAKQLGTLSASLRTNDFKAMLNAVESAEVSVKDLASLLEQIKKMDGAAGELWQARQGLLGASEYCRQCGKRLKACEKPNCTGCSPGHSCVGVCEACGAYCATGSGSGEIGPGMRGAGRGQGGTVGPLPKGKVSYTPTTLPGQVGQGKALATVLQRAAPGETEESKVEIVPDAFVKVKQEAEEALTKEEIPAGSREFVRQYFGSFEPGARK